LYEANFDFNSDPPVQHEADQQQQPVEPLQQTTPHIDASVLSPVREPLRRSGREKSSVDRLQVDPMRKTYS
jgi:hypothetical protein